MAHMTNRVCHSNHGKKSCLKHEANKDKYKVPSIQNQNMKKKGKHETVVYLVPRPFIVREILREEQRKSQGAVCSSLVEPLIAERIEERRKHEAGASYSSLSEPCIKQEAPHSPL